jgi:hypothetical protein
MPVRVLLDLVPCGIKKTSSYVKYTSLTNPINSATPVKHFAWARGARNGGQSAVSNEYVWKYYMPAWMPIIITNPRKLQNTESGTLNFSCLPIKRSLLSTSTNAAAHCNIAVRKYES